jgi:hypothetical protein
MYWISSGGCMQAWGNREGVCLSKANYKEKMNSMWFSKLYQGIMIFIDGSSLLPCQGCNFAFKVR